MKKLLKISALIAAMALSCAFFGCSNEDSSVDNNSNSGDSNEITSDGNNSNTGDSTTRSSNNGNENSNGNTSNNGNENSNEEELNLVGSYGISTVENQYKSSKREQAYTNTMPTSSSLRQYGTIKTIEGETTSVAEIDFTVTKTENSYSFNWAKYNVDGVAQCDDAKTAVETDFNDDVWNRYTAMFAMTITTTADGKWSDNSSPASSGTYTVDEANSKVTIKTLIKGEETLAEPEIMEATYSDNGKTLVVVQDDSDEYGTNKYIMTFARK